LAVLTREGSLSVTVFALGALIKIALIDRLA
jgi:hypothetical protein